MWSFIQKFHNLINPSPIFIDNKTDASHEGTRGSGAIAEAKRARTEANAERSAWLREQKLIADEEARVKAEAERAK